MLAVSLSLLALVAAATSDHPDALGRRGHDLAAGDRKATGIPSTLPPTPASTTTTLLTRPGSTGSPTGSGQAVTTGTAGDGIHIVTTPSTTVPTTSTTTTTSAIGPVPAQPAPLIRSGELQQPYVSTANEAFTGAGPMRISVTWSPTDSLSLSVSCPDGAQTAEGTTSAAVVIPDADGPCDLTLKIMLVQFDVISYTLTIAPAGG